MRQKINTVDAVLETADDAVAIVLTECYDEWDPNGHYEVGDRRKYMVNDKWLLYRCKQTHDANETWHPDVAVSLWDVTSDSSGTEDDVIEYSPGMVLEEGKYYSQDGVKYYCFRGSGNAVYHDLANLVGLYVNVVE